MIDVSVEEQSIEIHFTDEEGLGWYLTAFPRSKEGVYIESRDIGGMAISEEVAEGLHKSLDVISKWWYEQETLKKDE